MITYRINKILKEIKSQCQSFNFILVPVYNNVYFLLIKQYCHGRPLVYVSDNKNKNIFYKTSAVKYHIFLR